MRPAPIERELDALRAEAEREGQNGSVAYGCGMLRVIGRVAHILSAAARKPGLDDPQSRPVATPIPLLLWCPECGSRHIDSGAFAKKPHHTHACQSCGMTWRPAIADTVGVLYLPGFKDGT